MNSSPTTKRRDGYVYVAVLFTSLIVVATVAASLTISTANMRSQSDRRQRAAAIIVAESEIHRLAAWMRGSALWRSNATNDQFSPWREWTIGNPSPGVVRRVRHRYSDPDGSLSDSDTDSVRLTVHARVGNAETAVSVVLEPDPQPLDLLGYSVTCSDDLKFDLGGSLVTERNVQVADDCKTGSSGLLVTPQLECSGTIEVTPRGNVAAAAVSLPSYNVLDRYKMAGTQIPIATIPLIGGERTIEDVVLSPTINPLGTVDAGGIYWLDAGGGVVRISHARLDATLVIENAAEIYLSGGITWSYPALPEAILVADSPITIENLESTLREADRNVNFNPPSSAYRGTLSNSTTTDIYPTELRGMICSTQNIIVEALVDNATLPITGSILCRDLVVEGNVTIRQLDEWMDSPPIGIADRVPMRFVRGTFRRIPSP